MRNFAHVKARLFNTPLLVDPGKMDAIMQGLAQQLGVAERADNPQLGVPLPASPQAWGPKRTVPGSIRSDDKPYIVTRAGVGIVVAEGSLAHAAAGAYPPSGITAYTDLRAELSMAADDPLIRGILLDVSSAGGEASDSAFTLAALIRDIRQIKPVWAVADEMALSAGYLLASAASRLTVPPLGYIGSIGVYALHLDRSGFDKNEGLNWTYVKAGAHKVDGNPHEPLSASMRAKLQGDVDRTYERFLEEVGHSRPRLGVKGARATEASYYLGSDGVKLGLADAALDFYQTLAEFEELLSRGAAASFSVVMAAIAPPTLQSETIPAAPASAANEESPQPVAAGLSAQESSMDDPKNPAGQPAAAAAPSPETAAAAPAAPAAPAASSVVDINAARDDGVKYATEIMELCSLAGFPGKATGYIEQKKTAAEVRQLLQASKVAASAAEVTGGAAPGPAAGGESLIGACKALVDTRAKQPS